MSQYPARHRQAASGRALIAVAVTLRLALAVAVGGAVGALTEWSIVRLPNALAPLANTAAPWVLVAFAVALTARWRGEALVLAMVTLFALVLGFYATEASHGWAVSRHQVAFWLMASFVAGPLVGLAADWLRRGSRFAAGLGAGIVGGILAGEAVHGLRDLSLYTPHNYWRVQLALGLLIAIALPAWSGRRHLRGGAFALTGSLAACAAVGLGTLLAYQAP